MTFQERLRGHPTGGGAVGAVVMVLAVAGAYYGAARLGLLQELVRGQVTPLWPPTGIAVACLLWFGLRVWPGIALAAFLVNLPIGPSFPAVVAITAGNTLAPVVGFVLLRQAGFRTELDRIRDALALVFLGALAGMFVSATVGAGALTLSDAVPDGGFWAAWSVWWTGDAMGVLVITPLLLVLPTLRRPSGVSPYRWAEAALLLAGTAVVTLIATTSTVNLLFLVFPFLLWAALRFQLICAAPCVLIVSLLAIRAAANSSGPFQDHDLFDQMFTLQAFNGVASMTALLLSAIVTERNRTQRVRAPRHGGRPAHPRRGLRGTAPSAGARPAGNRASPRRFRRSPAGPGTRTRRRGPRSRTRARCGAGARGPGPGGRVRHGREPLTGAPSTARTPAAAGFRSWMPECSRSRRRAAAPLTSPTAAAVPAEPSSRQPPSTGPGRPG
ncbi:MASE1 domain-containing protein [Streptomyces sp. NPDC006460]|uniref:MASE1 domain-containing protein n=1 Tax=Streptomyces sp. NPDC006460 TaxID=3154304 RepID=UPI0033A1B04C